MNFKTVYVHDCVHVDDRVNDRKGLGFFVDVDVDVHVDVDIIGFYRLTNDPAR
jgi:hypothetical protein